MRKKFNLVLLGISAMVVLGFAGPAFAVVHFDEDFDYPTGQPLAGFGGWTETTPGAPISVEAGNYEYPGYYSNPGTGHLELSTCCQGNVQHAGPGAALDMLMGQDGTFYAGFLHQMSYKPHGGGWTLGPHSPGMVSIAHTSPGYRSAVILNDNSELLVTVPITSDNAVAVAAIAMDPVTEPGGDGGTRLPMPGDSQSTEGRMGVEALLNNGSTVHGLGFSSNNETTELTIARFTIDTLGDDMVEWYRSPDLSSDTWSDTPGHTSIGDFSGNTGYYVHLSGSHNDGGPRYDAFRITDTLAELLGASAVPAGWAGPSGDFNVGENWSPAGVPAGHNVILGSNATGNTTVFTNDAISVSNVSISDPASYVLGGHGPVNLDANTGGGSTGISVSSGNHQIQAPVNASVDATIDVAGGASLDVSGAVSLNGNTLTKAGDGTLSISNANSGGGSVDNTAGAMTSVASVDDYSQSAGATLIATISGNGGANAPGGHSQMVVGGTATLDGTLEINTAAGFVPGVGANAGEIGDTFSIIDGTTNGQFATVNGRHVGSGIFYDVDYASLTLGAFQATAGDTDGDKDVDITDFNSLVQNFDPTGGNENDWTSADYDGDNDVDITDFNSLVTNFAPTGYGDAPGAVPEPTGAVLIGLGLLLMGIRGVRRSK